MTDKTPTPAEAADPTTRQRRHCLAWRDGCWRQLENGLADALHGDVILMLEPDGAPADDGRMFVVEGEPYKAENGGWGVVSRDSRIRIAVEMLGDVAETDAWRPLALPASSNISGATYCAERRAVRVTFVSGHVYEYSDVPAEVAQAWETAPSAGKFFHATFRKSDAYPGTRVEPARPERGIPPISHDDPRFHIADAWQAAWEEASPDPGPTAPCEGCMMPSTGTDATGLPVCARCVDSDAATARSAEPEE